MSIQNCQFDEGLPRHRNTMCLMGGMARFTMREMDVRVLLRAPLERLKKQFLIDIAC